MNRFCSTMILLEPEATDQACPPNTMLSVIVFMSAISFAVAKESCTQNPYSLNGGISHSEKAVDACASKDTLLKENTNDDAQECCVTTRVIKDPNLNNCGGTRPVGLPFAGRSPVIAQHGMAATSQPLSTQVALDILKQGGSAVDAAIAANAMEGVVEPMMNGIGGDLMAMIYDATGKKIFGYNGSGRSSKTTTLQQMTQLVKEAGKKGDFMTSSGPLPVTVPGAAKGWCDLHSQFGKLPLAQVLAPAVNYAINGFPVSEVIAWDWELPSNNSEMTSSGKYPDAINGFIETFTINGKAPTVGQIFKNPDLGESGRRRRHGRRRREEKERQRGRG
eukprot:m.233020 g.233020  ORF g.233020 m.233020 type:complete len:334 (+) comp33632_c0_seq4:158-1159(+)